MKKKLITLFILVCAILLWGGCKAKKNEKEQQNQTQTTPPINYSEYITVKKYIGLEVDKMEVVSVSDAEVEASIKSDLEILATYTDITDRAAKLGDVATIDFVGKKDGVEFEGGSGDDYDLELGSGKFIPGFEEQVVGHKISETFDINVTFPKDYGNEELNGAAVVFTITIDALKEKHVPELTADILGDIGSSATTVEEYKAQVRADLEQSNKETAEANFQNAIWDALIAQCEMKKFPEGMVEEQIASLEQQYYYYASMNGMDTADFIQEVFQMTTEDLAKQQITLQFAIGAIAEAEDLAISDEDYSKGLAELAEQYGYDDPAKMEEEYSADNIRQSLLQEKVGKFLLENCKQVEAKK